ncbi:MAG: sigma-54-dependent Fis family transcriptional regulator [Candidatus Eisenbacteria bacterium]|uniref:Sigma-54-dependent Fis family transcriptional regulator n=1 Tax=Eiseniibacteriota bacterium TaxID=2212470 RepID=A0A538TUX6_UNCEI|nr:MAG: sigma-54-dependent Fis family transcriptional regulator [Candidatus Eisenbacteria bacterium]
MSRVTGYSQKQPLLSPTALGKIFRLGKNDTVRTERGTTLRVLVVDDHIASAEGLRDYLQEWGHEAKSASGVDEALGIFGDWRPDAVVCDLLMPPGPSGLELLRQVRAADPWVGFLMLTGHGTIEDAVKAIREGAFDFLTKPVDLERLRMLVNRIAERNEMRSEVTRLKRKLSTLGDDSGLVSRSLAMRRLHDLIEQVAPSSASVLITGESGSGKDFVAQTLHDLSGRSRAPFIAVNCPAIPEALLESELFGHERGAFTGALADRPGLFEHAAGGTLFLDEITEMSPGLQAKLLRVLETRRYRRVGGREERLADLRIVAATNRDPERSVSDGRLREDLYYRLNVFQLAVPPLRERREDIAPLAARFIAHFAGQNGRPVEGLSSEALAALEHFDWPGNVRELRNAIERAVVLARGPSIELADLPQQIARPVVVIERGASLVVEPLEEVERKAILGTLQRFAQNKTRAARALGISLKTLHNKLRRYRTEVS